MSLPALCLCQPWRGSLSCLQLSLCPVQVQGSVLLLLPLFCPFPCKLLPSLSLCEAVSLGSAHVPLCVPLAVAVSQLTLNCPFTNMLSLNIQMDCPSFFFQRRINYELSLIH